MKIDYHKVGDYYLPNLYLDTNFDYSKIGRYGRMRFQFLKENKKAEYIILFMQNKLQNHLLEIDIIANNRFEFLMKEFAKRENITEELKEKDQLKWVGLMNNIKHSAQEIVLKELIYV